MNTEKRYYIPKHAHAKAIAYFKRIHGTDTFPLYERDGCNGALVRTLDRKRPVAGMRCFFTNWKDGNRSYSTLIRFERTF